MGNLWELRSSDARKVKKNAGTAMKKCGKLTCDIDLDRWTTSFGMEISIRQSLAFSQGTTPSSSHSGIPDLPRRWLPHEILPSGNHTWNISHFRWFLPPKTSIFLGKNRAIQRPETMSSCFSAWLGNKSPGVWRENPWPKGCEKRLFLYGRAVERANCNTVW